MMTVKGQTHFRLMTVTLQGEQDGVFEYASSFNFTYLLRARELLLFFFLLHTPSFSLGFLMFVSFHQSSSDAFMQTHSPYSHNVFHSPPLLPSFDTASRLLTRLNFLTVMNISLISYKSSPHREEALQTQERKKGTANKKKKKKKTKSKRQGMGG